MNEIWLSVVGYEGLYEVSNTGKVKSLERYVGAKCGSKKTIREKILKHGINTYGYFHVGLYKNGKMKTKKVHNLLCEAFIGERPKGFDICHRDGVKTNNNLENLRYDSRSNNIQDMKLNNTWPSRENHAHKLTEQEVQKIYLLLRNSNMNYREIGKKYNVHYNTIHNINKGLTWHLDYIQYPIRKINKRTS